MQQPTPAANPTPAPAAPAPNPAQAPVTPKPAQATPPASPTPGASKPGAPAAVPPQGDKTVPITALLEERDKRQSLQAELDAMRKIVGQNVLFDVHGNPVSFNQPTQPTQANPVQQELEKLWETDPRRAVQTEIYQAMAWRDRQEAVVDQQEVSIAGKYPDYNDYRQEVRQYIRTLPIEQRGQPGVVELAYYIVRGQKVDNIIAKTKEQIEAEYRAKIAAGESINPLPTGSSGEPPAPNPNALSEEEKKAADVMGVTYEDYVRYKKM